MIDKALFMVEMCYRHTFLDHQHNYYGRGT